MVSSGSAGRRIDASILEALEPRAMLSAVTAQLQLADSNATSVFVTVVFSSDRPIDLSTVNGDEFRLVGQVGDYSMAGELREVHASQNTAIARYFFNAPPDHGIWTLGDNGRYVLKAAADSVRNVDGEGNAAADVHTFGLWFSTPSVSVSGENPDVYGMGYTGLPDASGRVSVYDEARFQIKYETYTLQHTAQRTMIVRLVGPNGYDQTTRVEFTDAMFTHRAAGGYQAVLPVRFAAPGMAWDSTDAGLYTLTVTPEPSGPGVVDALRGFHLQQEFQVVPHGVTAELASVSVTTGEMLVTMRYSHASGINVSTVGTGDVKVIIPGVGTFAPSLVGSPQVQNGVVTAVYRLAEPAQGWGAATGSAVVRTGLGEVRASNGETVGFAVSRTLNVAAGGRVIGEVKSAYTTASKLVIVMRYYSDLAVDRTTLADGDVRLTGPNGYDQLGDLVQVVPQANGEVRAVYHFYAPSGSVVWDFRTDNGRYELTVQPSAIREVGGAAADGIRDGFARSFGLYFRNPAMEVLTPAGVFNGTAVPTSAFDNTDAARIVVRYTTSYGRRSDWRNHALTATLTGPNGFANTQQLVNFTNDPYPSYGIARTTTDVDIRFAPPGGEWDASDTGVYTLTVYLNPVAGQPVPEAVIVQQFEVNVARPRVEVVRRVTSSTTMAVTVRYESPNGIDLSSISPDDVVLLERVPWWLYGTPHDGSLVGTPTVGPGGSVTATYRFTAPNGTPWTNFGISSLAVRPGQIRDLAGNLIGAALIEENFEVPNAQPDVVNVGTIAAASTAWDVEVILRNNGNLIDTSSIQPSNLVVAAPGGRVTRVGVESVVTSLDGTLRVRYRVLPQIGQRLVSGAYTLSLASNSLSLGVAGYLPGQTLGTFQMTF